MRYRVFEVGSFFEVPIDDEIITVPGDRTFSYPVDDDGITVSHRASAARTVSLPLRMK